MNIKSFFGRSGLLTLAVLASLQFAGCASVTLPTPSGTAGNVEKLKASGLAPMGTGEFKAAPGKAAEADKGLSVRGSNTLSPAQGSFALQLRDQLAAELKAAGMLAPNGSIVVSGTVTDNALEAGMSTGTARLAAKFEVRRDGKMVYSKELAASAQWESSFVGAVAIPAAFNQYGAVYQSLIGKLLDDADFRAAVKR